LEDGAGVRFVLLEERCGFWAEREVGDEDVAAAGEKKRGEAEVDA
jgi:hypothetical protein